ncbi:MAG TPA: endonuclease III [Bacteroidota bacterium]|nr:endonuclease III [Bacteroidota bacterium]
MSNESLSQRQQRCRKIISKLKKEYPGATTALEHGNPLQLLIATILSAQCTDERVNRVTPALFAKYRNVADFANADQRELEQEIRSTGFYRNKAKNIIACSRMILEHYQGRVPEKMEELLSLPGVGRKTANCVLGGAFGRAEGVVVDTHVERLSQRFGLTKETTPEKIEVDLMKVVPKREWYHFSNLLISHGRAICNARKPNCPECVIQNLCPSSKKFLRLYWR